MVYRYSSYDGAFYATLLRYDMDTRNLNWDSSKGCTVLIVQCPYGDSPFNQMEYICEKLSEIPRKEDQFIELENGVFVRFITPVQKVKNKGCPLHGQASSYAVFCCEETEEVCYIHAPQVEKRAFLNIPAEVEIEIDEEVYLKKRFPFRKDEEIPTGFYIIHFLKSNLIGYRDGDLVYSVNNMVIPVTGKMIQNGTFYIKSEKAPEFNSKNKGLKLVIHS